MMSEKNEIRRQTKASSSRLRKRAIARVAHYPGSITVRPKLPPGVLAGLLALAGLIFAAAMIFFVLTVDREGVLVLVGVATSIVTGTLGWVFGRKA